MIEDKERTKRQLEEVNNWAKVKGKGTFLGATGVGKSRIAELAVARVRSKEEFKDYHVTVIVPNSALNEQWNNKIPNSTVKTIQQLLIDNVEIHTNILIVDEVHRFASDKFKLVFQLIKYNYILCLTATLDRLDGKEEIIKKVAPVFGEISYDEAVKKGWIEEVKEYNLPVSLSPTENQLYHKLNESYKYFIKAFNFNFGIAMAIMQNKKININNKLVYYKDYWASEKNIEPGILYGKAIKVASITRERKTLLVDSVERFNMAKVLIAKGLEKEYKIVTFGESVETLIALQEEFPDAVTYHSKNKKATNDENLKLFSKGEKKVLLAAKAIDEGVDIPDIDLGIIISRNSSSISYRQRRGRICRKLEGKKPPILINIFIPETQDEEWLKNSQKGIKGIKQVFNLQQIEFYEQE